jgi:EpsI family protein
VPSWRTVGEWTGATVPRFEGVDGAFEAWYERGAVNVGAYVGFYAAQRQGHEVIYFDNRPEGDSAVVARQAVLPSATPIPFTELLLEDQGGKHRLAWFGTRVAGRDVSGAFDAKVRQIAGVIAGRRDAQVLILTAVCAPACEDARVALEDYAGAAQGTLYESFLP